MFDLDRFIEECRAAVAADPTHKSAREVVARAVSDPGGVTRALGAPTRAGNQCLYRSPELTILNLTWGPYMTLRPHNHRIWAVIGIYEGAEDNVFWRRIETETGPRIEAAGAKSLRVKDACAMGAEIIHSVTNPIPRLTAALHVYGGDFYRDDRSEWDPESLGERPFDFETSKRLFEESNARLVGV
ncbi:MAG TPA: hypothetical protein VD970_04225 [Acetobacteraceae bacterium]|nr:hypothetical protein [Acetobacteraceae bacterium]